MAWPARKVRLIVGVALVVSLAGLGAGPTHGSPVLRAVAGHTVELGPVKTLRGEGGFNLTVLVDGSGNTTVVWSRRYANELATPPRTGQGAILGAYRPAGGPWRRTRTIGYGADPQAVVDGNGNVTVVWATRVRGWTDGVRAVRKPTGHGWGRPVQLSHDVRAPGYRWPGPPETDPGEEYNQRGAQHVDLAVNARGAVVVTWQWGQDDYPTGIRERPLRIQAVYRAPRGRWERPVDVTRPNWSEEASVAIGPRGHAFVVYHRSVFERMLAQRLVLGRGWTPPARLYGPADDAEAVVTPRGSLMVVFHDWGYNRLLSISRPPRGPWDRAPDVVARRDAYHAASSVVDASGAVTVAWTPGRRLFVSRLTHGTWGRPRDMGPYAGQAALSGNSAGDLLVVSPDPQGGVLGRYRPRGGPWTAAISLTASETDSRARYEAAVYPRGAAIAAWRTADGRIQVRTLRRHRG